MYDKGSCINYVTLKVEGLREATMYDMGSFIKYETLEVGGRRLAHVSPYGTDVKKNNHFGISFFFHLPPEFLPVLTR